MYKYIYIYIKIYFNIFFNIYKFIKIYFNYLNTYILFAINLMIYFNLDSNL